MIKLGLLSLLIVMFSSPARVGMQCSLASDILNRKVTVECPKISVDCPDPFDEQSPFKFEAHVSGINPNQKMKYHWTVYWVHGFRKGRIKSGQGTSSIVIEASGPARKGLTVKVEIRGLPKGCDNKAYCTTSIA